MEAYSDFAEVYDIFMDNTPYEAWSEFLMEYLKAHGIFDGILLDLGCGTGVMTELFAGAGYDMIGADISSEMLNIALNRKAESGLDILYLCQDMRELELFGTVRAVYSVCDCVNYLLTEEDLKKTFSLVNNYLDPQGLFIFDFNTVHKYRDVIGDTVIAENREECSFIWENSYDEETQKNQYDVTIFVKENTQPVSKSFFKKKTVVCGEPLFRRFQETHVQRGYTLETMKRLVEEAGLLFVEAIDADTHEAPDENSERIYMVAMENVPGKSTSNRNR